MGRSDGALRWDAWMGRWDGGTVLIPKDRLRSACPAQWAFAAGLRGRPPKRGLQCGPVVACRLGTLGAAQPRLLTSNLALRPFETGGTRNGWTGSVRWCGRTAVMRAHAPSTRDAALCRSSSWPRPASTSSPSCRRSCRARSSESACAGAWGGGPCAHVRLAHPHLPPAWPCVNSRPSLLWSLASWDQARFGLFLGSFTGVFKGANCLLRHARGKEDNWNGPSGLTMLSATPLGPPRVMILSPERRPNPYHPPKPNPPKPRTPP